jgi:two-component system response regulator YesN
LGDKYKVLIVEDEVLVRGGLKSVISWGKLGMEIIGDAANGRAALEIYEKDRPDIILTDIKMPVMDGLEMIARIRETDEKTKIVILTCYEEFVYLQEAMRMGVSDYISKLKMKPAEIETAMEKLKRELDESRGGSGSAAGERTGQKEDIFKQYIFYHQIPIDIFRARIGGLHLGVREKDIVMCRMMLGKYEKVQTKISDAQGMLIRFLIMNMAGEIIKRYGEGEIIQEKEDCYLLLINVDNTAGEKCQELKYVLQEVSRILSGYLDSHVIWGISRVYGSWDRLPEMYQECCRAMKHAYLEKGILFPYGMRDASEGLELQAVREAGRQFLPFTPFCGAQLDGLMKQLTSYASEEELTKENADDALLHFLYRCKEKQQDFSEEMLQKAAGQIRESTTFPDAVQTVVTCCREGFERRNELSVEIYEAVRYIEEHLSGKLTLNQVAGHIGLSPNYLSSLFKKELHISFVDYITEKRVIKAKELLLETDLKTHEVAEITGFADDSYFSKTFKKITGRLPSSFRKRTKI